MNIGLENYTPLALFAVDPQTVMVNADLPYKTLKDLAEAARKQPDTIVCAITNPLGSGRIVIHELEKLAPGAKFKFVTFKGGGEAVLSVAGGHTHFTTENLSEGLAHARSEEAAPARHHFAEAHAAAAGPAHCGGGGVQDR